MTRLNGHPGACKSLLHCLTTKKDRERVMCEVLARIPYQPCGATADVLAQELFGDNSRRAQQRIRAAIRTIWGNWRIVIAEATVASTGNGQGSTKEYWIKEKLSRQMAERKLHQRGDPLVSGVPR